MLTNLYPQSPHPPYIFKVMMMVGIKPVPDALGRVNKLEVIPLEELGRPRVDVVVNCSGVFRDLFVNQVGKGGGSGGGAVGEKMGENKFKWSRWEGRGTWGRGTPVVCAAGVGKGVKQGSGVEPCVRSASAAHLEMISCSL